MSPDTETLPELDFHPLSPGRWKDFETLFGPRGACGGCWCMWWKLKRSEFNKQKGEENRKAMKEIVESGRVPGLLAYADDVPVAWCAVGPREYYPALERSRIMKRIDEQIVWSIVCFFVEKKFRRKGMTARLLEAAVQYAGMQGARIVEGYPVEPRKSGTADAFVFTGLASAFRNAGFVEVARRSETRPFMRYYIEGKIYSQI